MRAALADTRMRGRALSFVIRRAPQDLARAPSFLRLGGSLLLACWSLEEARACPWVHPLLSGLRRVRPWIPASADRRAVHPK
ncbi:hypothetical protein CGRA01v4_01240 [Colletotrichum graminicola]|nr:hypothetical protein CGRA01v4_01240 [Colletotrichum graminicola]